MMLRLKTFSIAVVMAACMGAIHAQNLISEDIEQNGTVYGFGHVLTEAAPLIFSLRDNDTEGEWNVGILNPDGGYVDTEFETENSGKCIFNLATVARQFRSSARLYDDLDERCFFQIKVSSRTNDGVDYQRFVRLRLVPTKPVLYDINFNCVYENDYDFIHGYTAEENMFSFTAESAKATSMLIYFLSDYFWPCFGGEDQEKLLAYHCTEYYEGKNGKFRINEELFNWGQYIFAYARNELGLSPKCDPILTTWYITDPDILARIEELRQLSALDHPDADMNTPHVVWQHNAVRSDTELRTLSVYDMLGSLCGQYHKVSSVDLSHLRRGVYVVTYEISDNQSGKLKIARQ